MKRQNLMMGDSNVECTKSAPLIITQDGYASTLARQNSCLIPNIEGPIQNQYHGAGDAVPESHHSTRISLKMCHVTCICQ